MRTGDPSVWPLWAPEPLPASDVLEGWRAALAHRGEPGFPETVHVYTHFPYCVSSCNFCMYFHEVPRDPARYRGYADYLVGLAGTVRHTMGHVHASHAYFGGGTPSAMPFEELARYFAAFRETFTIAGQFTFEAHPGTTDRAKLELCASHGVNRLSMGVQSLDPEVLRKITRRNRTLDEIGEIVATAQAVGMKVNLDLVTGLPGQSPEGLREDVRRVLALSPDWLTLYGYQPVARLPGESPHMAPSEILGDDLLAAEATSRGYSLAILPHVGLLTRSTASASGTKLPAGRFGSDAYVEFDADASQMIGLGPDAYSHVYGYASFREVTDLSALDPERPVYFGTKMTRTDECRQSILGALDAGRCVDAGALALASGLDVEAFLDACGAKAGLERGACHAHCYVPRDRGEAMEHVRASVALAAPAGRVRSVRLPLLERATESLVSVHPETTRPTGRARAWCEALGIPSQGKHFGDVWVRKVDDQEVWLAVDEKSADPIRIRVEPPDAPDALVRSRRFAIVACARAHPFSARERGLLGYLARATRVRDGE